MRILYLSTKDEVCGVADYTRRLAQAVAELGHEVEFFESLSVLKRLGPAEFDRALVRLTEALQGCDVVHVQHELAFFEVWQAEALARCLERFAAGGGRAIVTIHTTLRHRWPWPLVRRFFPTNWRAAVDAKVAAFTGLTTCLVHTGEGRRVLRSLSAGRRADIRVIPHPIDLRAAHRHPVARLEWMRQQLDHRPGDVLVSMPGFVSKNKRPGLAVSALAHLPPHFKLVLAGGVHPQNDPAKETHELHARIRDLKLQQRVRITGYLSEADLGAILALSTLTVFPYSPAYGSASGSVGLALAAGKCAVVSPTAAFLELSRQTAGVVVCRSDTPAGLAKVVQQTALRPPFTADEIAASVEKLSYAAIARRLDREVYRSPVATGTSPRSRASARHRG